MVGADCRCGSNHDIAMKEQCYSDDGRTDVLIKVSELDFEVRRPREP